MQPIPFTAASAEEALAQIRARLGPEAVVLNVRRLPQNGLSRLWQKPLIEVLAYLPDTQAPTPEAAPLSETLAEFRQQLNEIKQQVEDRQTPAELIRHPFVSTSKIEVPTAVLSLDDEDKLDGSKWRIVNILRKSGMLPLPTQQVLEQMQAQHGEHPPESLGEELVLAKDVMKSMWRAPKPVTGASVHILIGPAGSGKTTCLCKWLTQAVLMESRSARVWRLDNATANTAESLSVYCDILGAPSERVWEMGDHNRSEEIKFIDLPGIDWCKPLAIKELAANLKQFGSPRIHLALNGAYDTSILLAQARAFASLSIEDIVLTHLDEETRWGKVWNLVLGTNYSVRYFSTGQNIPGDFHTATPELVFARQFPCK